MGEVAGWLSGPRRYALVFTSLSSILTFVFADDDAAGLYTGRSFKKDDVIKALKLWSTTANNNEKLFAPAIMRQIPKLLEWYNSPDGEHAAFFGDMTTKQFLKWRDDEYALATGSKGKEKAKRKHAEGGESRTSKKTKRISSEELDSE